MAERFAGALALGLLLAAGFGAPSNGYELVNLRQGGEAGDLVAELIHEDGLGSYRPDELIHNREGTTLPEATEFEVADIDPYHTGFRWNSGDQDVTYWMPQGITGSANAFAEGTTPEWRKLLLVSWYCDEDDDFASSRISIPGHCVDQGNDDHDKGVRISLVDVTDWPTVTYRHVVLVEPFRNAHGNPHRARPERKRP